MYNILLGDKTKERDGYDMRNLLQKLKKEDTQIKLIFVGAVIVLIAILIPLFQIAHFNFRSMDDFSYAKNAETVWEETHSLLRVLLAQIPYTIDYWHSWQGTFFSEWFTTSMMGIFSKDAYYMGTYFTLGSLVLSELFAFVAIMRKVLGADIYSAGIVAISCICLQVLLVPSPAEAFYWFCGAMLYIFIHALAVILVALLVLLYYQKSAKKWAQGMYCALIVFLTIAVAGSNYITALTMLIIYLVAVVWYWYRKHAFKWFVSIGSVLYIFSFLVNVLAPGNMIRQISSGVNRMGVVESIILSLKEALIYVISNAILPCFVLAIMMLPIFVKMVKNKRYRYPFPLLVSLFTFGIFAAQFTPNIYALGITGVGRIQNLYRINFYIWLFANELYWTGWYCRLLRERNVGGDDSHALESENREKKSLLLQGWIIGGIILCISLVMWGGTTVTSYSALMSLRRGEAQRYYAEYQERLHILQDETIEEVELAPFSTIPYTIYFGDITKDANNWVNTSVANYYGKESVKLKE